jgi:hypothetical protein
MSAAVQALGIAAALAASLIVLVIADASVLEAWLLGFILLAGVSAGALALLLTGHILGETWLQPIRAELEAIADLVPMVAVLAVPVLANPDALYRWVGGDTGTADRDWLDRSSSSCAASSTLRSGSPSPASPSAATASPWPAASAS